MTAFATGLGNAASSDGAGTFDGCGSGLDAVSGTVGRGAGCTADFGGSGEETCFWSLAICCSNRDRLAGGRFVSFAGETGLAALGGAGLAAGGFAILGACSFFGSGAVSFVSDTGVIRFTVYTELSIRLSPIHARNTNSIPAVKWTVKENVSIRFISGIHAFSAILS
jgi:hypothetical protein